MDARLDRTGVYGGVDVGGTKTAAVIMDDDGRVRGSARVPTVPGQRGVLSSIVDAVGSAMRDAGDAPIQLRAVGVGVPGAVECQTGTVRSAVNVGLHEAPLGDLVSASLGAAAHIDNDVNLAALGLAATKGSPSSLAYINLGTGFGVGIVIQGVPLRGVTGAAGEIGHLPFDGSGVRCPCGQIGCIELAASGGALARAAGARSIPELFVDAAAGDSDSLLAVTRFCEALALGIRIVVQAYDVAEVALGGGVFTSAEKFMPRIREILAMSERDSPLLSALRIVDRLRVVDSATPHAALGAARWAMAPQLTGSRPDQLPKF